MLSPDKLAILRAYSKDEESFHAILALMTEAQDDFARVFFAGPDSITISTPGHAPDYDDRRYIEVNQTFLDLTGYQHDEVVGHQVNDLQLWEDPDEYRIIGQRIQREGLPIVFEARYRRRNGEIFYGITSLNNIQFSGELCSLAITRDITPLKEAQAALARSEERRRILFEEAPSGIAQFVAETQRFEINKALVDFLGYPKAHLETLPLDELLPLISHPDDLAKEQQLVAEVDRHQLRKYQMEKRYIRSDGSIVWGDLTTLFVRDTQGHVRYSMSMVIDITERKAAEARLKAGEEIYRLLLRHLPGMAIMIFDRDLRYLLVEGGALVERGYNPIEMQGRTIWDVMPAERVRGAEPYYRQALDGQSVSYEYEHGGYQYLANFVPVPYEDTMYGMLVVLDVTESYKAQAQALSLQMERARVHILSDFITHASHEFKTPLSVISSSAYLLSRLQNEADRLRHVEKINVQVHGMTRLVDSLITMVRVDNRERDVSAPVDLNALLQVVVTTLEGQINAQSLIVEDELQANLPLVRGDYEELMIAFRHLLENAIQYTLAGGYIRLRTFIDGSLIVIEVADTGKGISEEHLPHIFERFYRGDTAHSTRGFGLGLPIAERIITGHGGKIMVESVVGKGSVFRVSLPLNAPL